MACSDVLPATEIGVLSFIWRSQDPRATCDCILKFYTNPYQASERMQSLTTFKAAVSARPSRALRGA
jgi:hypothetical protein